MINEFLTLTTASPRSEAAPPGVGKKLIGFDLYEGYLFRAFAKHDPPAMKTQANSFSAALLVIKDW
ncbi:hypothetical protein AB5I41_28980 [Sphingomonas sp. MMS24-JH45]